MNSHLPFIGFESSYEEARLVLFGAPFDGTTSFRPGTRFGPATIRTESYGLETYSPYLNRDLQDLQLYDAGDLELPFGNPASVLSLIEQKTARILQDGKLPFLLGGEHLVTLGVVRALSKHYPDLCILHFDAHTDLRQEYLGEELSHATVLRRCHELVGDGRIYQFGIRSGTKEEFLFAQRHLHQTRFDLEGIKEAVQAIGNFPVYVTVDLDVLDPAYFCGTGTLEPGGVTFKELLGALKEMDTLPNIVGCDVVELSPHYDPSGMSNAVACKVVRELALSVANTKI